MIEQKRDERARRGYFKNFALIMLILAVIIAPHLFLSGKFSITGFAVFQISSQSDFDQGTLHLTKVIGTGAEANVTLDYTVSSSGIASGIREYYPTGNFTSQVFDTNSTASVFDKIAYTINLINTTDIVGAALHNSPGDIGVFYKNGSIATDRAQGNLITNVDFSDGIIRYALPAGFSYDDIIGIAWDTDASDAMFVFFKNGSVTSATVANLVSDITFSGTGTWSLPAGFNVSDIIDFEMESQATATGDIAVFMRNLTYFALVDVETPPFNFDTARTYSLPAGFDTNNAFAVALHSGVNDIAMFFRNGSHVVDNTQADFTTDIAFTDGVLTDAYANVGNNTERANITIFTRVSNDSSAWTPWTEYANGKSIAVTQDSGIGSFYSGAANITPNAARYIQYKAVFTTYDKYYTPLLENVSINYTIGAAAADTMPPAFSNRQPSNDSSVSTGLVQFNITITEVGGGIANITQLWMNATGIWALNLSDNYTSGGKHTFNATDFGSSTYIYWAVFANDSAGNFNWTQNFSLKLNQDTALPTVKTAFNISSPVINDIINFTGNVTDETGLLGANITYNISGTITKVNFTLNGTTAQVSNAAQVCSSACVINFTMYATDTSNNVKQNSTLIAVSAVDITPPKLI